MFKNKKIVAIIPARGGSKSIPKKNIKNLLGKPLIFYSIKASLHSRYIDRVIVSTENAKIAQLAKNLGAEIPFLRPKNLAADSTPTLPVLKHALAYLENKKGYRPDIVVLIQPTSPFVLPQDIDTAIEKLFKENSKTCFSVCEVNQRPEWMYKIEGKKIIPIIKSDLSLRRQDLPPIYISNGSVFVSRKETLMEKNRIIDSNSSIIIMPRERSIDIDEPFDFAVAKLLMKAHLSKYRDILK